MHCTGNAGLYSRLQTWQRDIEFIFGGTLNKETTKAKANYLICWLGQRPKITYSHRTQNLQTIKKSSEYWKEFCKPKQNEIASFTKLRNLRKGHLSLSEFINTTQLLVQECKYPSDFDRLLQDIITSGVNSITAYKWCIDIGMNLTLEKAIEICTAEDSTRRQIESLRPYLAKRTLDRPALDQKEVHKFNTRHSPPKGTSFKHKYPESIQSTQSNNSKCFFCRGPQAHKDRSKCPAVKKECHNCKIIGNFDRVCKKPRMSCKTSHQTQVKYIQSQSPSTSKTREFIDCAPEYTSVFFTSPTEAQAETIHQIQTCSKIRGLETIHKLTAKTFCIQAVKTRPHPGKQ